MCVHTVLFLYMHSDTMNTTHQESIKMAPYHAVFGLKVRQRQTSDQACSLYGTQSMMSSLSFTGQFQ